MKIYLATVSYYSRDDEHNSIVKREFICSGDNENLSKYSLIHLLDELKLYDTLEIKMVEISTPFEIF